MSPPTAVSPRVAKEVRILDFIGKCDCDAIEDQVGFSLW